MFLFEPSFIRTILLICGDVMKFFELKRTVVTSENCVLKVPIYQVQTSSRFTHIRKMDIEVSDFDE